MAFSAAACSAKNSETKSADTTKVAVDTVTVKTDTTSVK